jgi:G3E family GTPase
VTVVDASTFGTDFMTWDVAGQRDGWVDPADDCAAQRKVPELLAEQVEAADVLIINKIDLAGEEQVKVASELARTLNEKARLETVSFGKASTKEILKKLVPMEESSIEVAAHGHDHDHSSSCEDPTCTDPSHSHSHSHSHENEAGACSDPDCTDTSHSHSHDHGSDVSACTDPDCTDTSHTHTHSHSHSTSTDNLGIVNFVYKSDRPFNTMKLLTLLNKWPVPIKDDLDLSLLKEAQKEGYSIQGQEENSPFVGVLRSKGFCWFAPTKWSGQGEDVWRHDTAMYWSHAGKHFGISSAGKWWGTIGKEQMKKYFKDNMDEYNRIVKEDFVSEEFGDRRQEIVFIGVNLDEEEITHALDNCLLTEKGLERYRQELKNFEMTVLTSPGAEPSLFDVGGTDHLDDEQ